MDFEIKVDKRSKVPIYIQLKNQIMDAIKNGYLKIGTKMPTERELSSSLNTSRNTVSSAYSLLEQEGILVSYQGKGTFVAEEGRTWKQLNMKDRLLKIIDLGLEEALEMGLDTKEFLNLVQERISEKEEILSRINAIFIECNIEQAREFSKQLSRETGLNVTPVVLSNLENRDENLMKTLENSELIIATFNHVNDVKNLTSDLKRDVLGVAINPSLETIVKIARYPKGTKFGLVCISNEFKFKIQNALSSAGLNLDIIDSTSRKFEDVSEVIQKSNVIIVSPGRREEIEGYVKGKKDVISFDYNLDAGSVKAIISKIVEVKNNK